MIDRSMDRWIDGKKNRGTDGPTNRTEFTGPSFREPFIYTFIIIVPTIDETDYRIHA